MFTQPAHHTMADGQPSPPPVPPAPNERRTWLRRAGAAVATATVFLTAMAVGLTAYMLGWVGLAMATMLPVAALIAIGVVGIATMRRRIDWSAWRTADVTTSRRDVARAAARSLGWVLIAAASWLSLPQSMISQRDLAVGAAVIIASATCLVLLSWAPRRRPLGIVTALVVTLGAFSGWQLVQLAVPLRSQVVIAAPVSGDWVVQTGGNGVLVNHHYALRQQRYALDLVMPYDHDGNTTRKEVGDYPAFAAPVLAPGDGRVARVEGSRPDQPVATMDPLHPLGNFVVVELAGNRYVLLAHLMAGSITVEPGDRVATGDRLAAVGNSGNSSEPHLHLQVQDGPDLMNADGSGWEDINTVPFSFGSGRAGGELGAAPRRDDLLELAAGAR